MPSLFKKVMAVETLTVLQKFLNLRESYSGNSQVVFNRESQFWESFLLMWRQLALETKVSILESLSTVS